MWKQVVLLATLSIHLSSSDRTFVPIRAQFSPSKSRIIGGEEVEPHSVPFQAALHINGNSYCGGALISPNYVLTAGHCGIVLKTVDVILGAHNLSNTNEETQVRIKGERTIIHDGYDDDTLQNDITLIQLAEPAPINDYIKVVPLPTVADVSRSYLDETAEATGWGLYRDVPFPSTRDMSDVLLKVDVPISNLTECEVFYDSDEGSERVYETNVCTSGNGNRGTCNGDSGGPLVLDGVLIGLTSFGTDLCEVCSPSVYTRVADYLDWIAENSDVEVQ